MLCLTRTEQQSVMIGDDIKVQILEITKQHGEYRVRLGIRAPTNVSVHREEVYEAIKCERERSEA